MDDAQEHFRIMGDVGSPVFALWIARHAARLGLLGRVLVQGAAEVEVVLSGPPDLLDAMELGCSLGPREVWVERIERVVL